MPTVCIVNAFNKFLFLNFKITININVTAFSPIYYYKRPKYHPRTFGFVSIWSKNAVNWVIVPSQRVIVAALRDKKMILLHPMTTLWGSTLPHLEGNFPKFCSSPNLRAAILNVWAAILNEKEGNLLQKAAILIHFARNSNENCLSPNLRAAILPLREGAFPEKASTPNLRAWTLTL